MHDSRQTEIDRRNLLKAAGVSLAGVGLAGCSSSKSTDTPTGADSGATATIDAELAAATGWNALRARLYDALALGIAGEGAAGAAVAADILADFEAADAKYGVHEFLESTSETRYHEFEEALKNLRDALKAGKVETAREEAATAGGHLSGAQATVVETPVADALDLLYVAARTADAAFLAPVSADAAATVAGDAFAYFEEAPSHDSLEEADHEAYETFEHAIEDVQAAAKSGGDVAAKASAAVAAGVDAAAALTVEQAVGAGHLALQQAQGRDAATLAAQAEPGADFAHAATLTAYRLRVHDAAWLAAHGETDTAATMAGDVLSHFENAAAHEPLEHADHEAYEQFEHGVENLEAAIGNGDSQGIQDALAQTDDALVTGTKALAGDHAAVLEAGFFRARIQDARERYLLGQNNEAAGVVDALFAAFEADELGFHAAFEHADHEGYETFEHALEDLAAAFRNTNDSGVEKHASTALQAALDFETTAGSEATVSGAEGAYLAGRGFDAATVAALGKRSRAADIATAAMEHFEAGAGGFHEAVEHADHETYEAYEANLEAIASAANNGKDVYAAATAFFGTSIDAVSAVVTAASGDFAAPAAALVEDVVAAFEDAAAHELLEAADHATYEAYESKLKALKSAIESDGDVATAADAYATAAVRAQFAVVGALDKAPSQ